MNSEQWDTAFPRAGRRYSYSYQFCSFVAGGWHHWLNATKVAAGMCAKQWRNLQHARMLILLIVMGFNIALCLPGCVPCYPSCTPSSQKRHSSRTNASVPNHFIHIHAEQTHTGWLVGNVHIPANNGPTFFGEVILNDFIISHYSSHVCWIFIRAKSDEQYTMQFM